MTNEPPSERLQDAIAHAAVNFKMPQRSTPRRQVYLCCVDREGEQYHLRLWPYWTQHPVDILRFASEALESAANPIERLGHFHFPVLNGTLQVIAWRGRFAGATSAIYEIGQDGEIDSSRDTEEFYYYLLMSHIAATDLERSG